MHSDLSLAPRYANLDPAERFRIIREVRQGERCLHGYPDQGEGCETCDPPSPMSADLRVRALLLGAAEEAYIGRTSRDDEYDRIEDEDDAPRSPWEFYPDGPELPEGVEVPEGPEPYLA